MAAAAGEAPTTSGRVKAAWMSLPPGAVAGLGKAGLGLADFRLDEMFARPRPRSAEVASHGPRWLGDAGKETLDARPRVTLASVPMVAILH